MSAVANPNGDVHDQATADTKSAGQADTRSGKSNKRRTDSFSGVCVFALFLFGCVLVVN